MMTMTREWLRARASRARALGVALLRNTGGLAAVEFTLVLPIMLVLYFGTVEISNAVAVYRKVTIMAHTLSDLTSQSEEVQSSDLTNFFSASSGVMMPYSSSPIAQTITELWVSPGGVAYVQWSSGSTPLTVGSIFTSFPASLVVANSYVIFSQVSYVYTPMIGYVLPKAGITLTDFSYTRPRVFTCVLYQPTLPLSSPPPACPTTT
jgi:Flp pilus assembly protein TadG